MGRCSVIGCKTSFKRKLEGGKHLYRFPRHPADYKRRHYWARFTRRGSKFTPKASSLICQEHFEDKYIVLRKNRVCLTKDAVPTLYNKHFDNGTIERTIVPFTDLDNYCQDSEDDPIEDDGEDPEEVAVRVQTRMEEIKNSVCRFCGQIKEPKLEMAKFDIYKVDVAYFMEMMQISREYDEYLSESVCEECFEQVVSLEIFRVKSKEAELAILSELKSLNPHLPITVKGIRLSVPEDSEEQIIETIENYQEFNPEMENKQEPEMQVEYIEEYEDYETQDDSNINESAEYKQYEEFTAYKVEYDPNIQQNEIVESIEIPLIIEKPKKPKKPYKKEVIEPTDVYGDDVPEDGIIRNPERNRLVLQIYNCVYCKKNFGGRKTYRAHSCDRKEIKCEDCDKTFKKLRSYKQHKLHEHETVKTLKHYCPMCKTVIMGAMSRFKIHRRSCNKERSDPIECEICGRKCDTLTGYTVHKLFHDVSKNKDSKNREKKVKEEKGLEKEEWICEQCGKTFKSISGYQCHILTIHTKTEEIFQCPTCGKVCANKLALKDHKRNTHKVEESPCNVCGKVFRTKVLLRKHMMYHDESKRIFKCQFCPDKPGYFTNVALKRHQRSHNGERPYSCTLCPNNYSTSTQLKYHINKTHGSTAQVTMQQVTIHTITNIEPTIQQATNLTITGI